MSNALRVASIMLVMASIACGTPGQSATAINPPTLTLLPRPTLAQTATPSPTVQPAAALAATQIDLKIGGPATIHTTSGDKLRIHTRPSYDAPVIMRLDDGTPVMIIAGPQVVGTDHWWQIETADGQSGWAVEYTEGVQTLLPGD